jgi:integrase
VGETPRFTVSQRRDGTWRARAYLGTDPVTHQKRRPERRLPQARTEAEALEYARAWAETLAPKAADSRPLADMLAEYVDGLAGYGRAAQTVEAYRTCLRRQVAPTIGTVPVGELTAWEVSTCYRILMAGRRGEGPVGTSTVLKVHSLLSGAYAQWSREGLVSNNPMPSVTKPRRPLGSAHAIGEADFRALSAKLAEGMGSASPTDRATAAIAYVCLSCGLRCGEACALERSSLRTLTHELQVHATMTERPRLERKPTAKSAAGCRNVHVDPECERALLDLMARLDSEIGPLAADAPLVTIGGGFIRPSVQSERFSRLASEMGLPAGTTMHTLRHTHATMLLYGGVPVETIRQRLGHSDVATTLRLYAHVMEGADRAAAEAWEGVREALR